MGVLCKRKTVYYNSKTNLQDWFGLQMKVKNGYDNLKSTTFNSPFFLILLCLNKKIAYNLLLLHNRKTKPYTSLKCCLTIIFAANFESKTNHCSRTNHTYPMTYLKILKQNYWKAFAIVVLTEAQRSLQHDSSLKPMRNDGFLEKWVLWNFFASM